MTTPPPPPGSGGGNEPYDPTGSNPYPSSGSGSTPADATPADSTPSDSTPPPPPGSGQPPYGAPPPPADGQPPYGAPPPPADGQPPYGAPPPPPYGNAPVPGGSPGGGSDTPRILSLVSMGTGIVGLILCCCWTIPILPIAALVTGFIAQKQAKETGRTDLKSFILVGLITGAVGLALGVVVWILNIAGVGFGGFGGFDAGDF